MTDFLITTMVQYPWFAWLLVTFFAVTVAFWLLLGIVGVKSVLDWSEMKREDRRILADILARAHSDPPEYQHPDGDDDDLTELMDEPPDDWSPKEEWGEHPGRAMASLAEVLIRAREIGMLNDDDELPDGWLGLPDKNDPPDGTGRCNNRDCYRYGMEHPGACDVAPTMPAACYPERYTALWTNPKYAEGPAMPPQPVREYLHPAIMDDLEAAGFSEHETTDGAVESMFTRAMAKEVQAMVTDGVIPTDETGRSH